MSIDKGWKMLQVNSEDKSEVEKFKVKAHGKSSAKMDKKADALRNKGYRCRVIWEEFPYKEWVVYARKGKRK